MKKLPLIITIVFITACQTSRKEPHLPFFNLLLTDSITRLNTAMIPEGKPTILLYFSPDCEHCHDETENLLHSMDSLKNVRFYFITTDSFDRMKAFGNYYKVQQYPNITLARDYTSFFPRHFNNPAPPYMIIYDQHKRQKGVFSEAITATQIIEFVNNL